MNGAQAKMEVHEDLFPRLEEARAITDRLFDVVKPEALYDRPIAERHRIVFYIGHLEAFDWNLFRGRAFAAEPFHPQFDRLFAFGIDPVGGGLPADQPSDWPRLEEIREYNRRLRQEIDSGLGGGRAGSAGAAKPGGAANGPNGSATEMPSRDLLLHVAAEHRLMHAETLAYMFHQLPLDHKFAKMFQASRPTPAVPVESLRPIEIPPGTATLGLARGDRFGWDNEFMEHVTEVPGFTIDEYKVTNGEFLKFLREGGYQERSLWDDKAWQWITSAGVRHPAFWSEPDGRDGHWFYRTMSAEIPLPAGWPVYVSHAEASAYARWAGKRLPTEAEWHRAAYGAPHGPERDYPWGSDAPNARFGNFDSAQWDPTPVNAYPAGRSGYGVADLVGNGWEWTSTVFAPFPGFEPFSFYPGYSAGFFDGQHYVMKGASARTAACMLRPSFRNWFQPRYPFVYAGFRCVEN
ncbi:MAG TPA: SUMF1/EgtB/PvdO family nonheme iron enzyme [Terriglobia bacterium]|nr:SUMF1/EgtB/PvdO family nonheme iron enzyme [Terriglobia bacterium]